VSPPVISRRHAIQAIASTAALPLLPACTREQAIPSAAPAETGALALLDRPFNDTVVLGGNVPLDVLGRNVEEHIRTRAVAP
jgi:hypothetical protein